VKRWEYHREWFNGTHDVLPLFNRRGNEGWELVSVVELNGTCNCVAFFKREVQA
jgi:hypothetical protein